MMVQFFSLGLRREFKEVAMIKIYGMPTCPYCDYVHEQIKGREYGIK